MMVPLLRLGRTVKSGDLLGPGCVHLATWFLVGGSWRDVDAGTADTVKSNEIPTGVEFSR